ncbi:MAG TPA: hypothetical protein VFO11_01665 [Candidatus Polarisedimenticolaceae bacterium]|nr:hypothetical protein [Candidatus Polarisedimenticolaceae bacterium]
MRTTLDIDDTVLRELKRLQQKEKKSLGRLVSDLLASALRQREPKAQAPREFRWISQRMEARVDLADHDAILDLLDRAERKKTEPEG